MTIRPPGTGNTGPLQFPNFQPRVGSDNLGVTSPGTQTGTPNQTSSSGEVPGHTNDTRTYGDSPFDPVSGPGLQLPNQAAGQSEAQVSLANDYTDMFSFFTSFETDDINQVKSVPPEQRAKFDGMAQALGFKDFQTMQYQMRNLNSGQQLALLRKIKDEIRLSPPGTDGQPELSAMQNNVKTAISDYFRTQVSQMFTERGHQPPVFEEAGGKWDPASMSSVFNALSEIKRSSQDKFDTIARGTRLDTQGNQEPLKFVRKGQPTVSENQGFLRQMESSTMIAEADNLGGEVFIYDTAVTGDVNSIAGRITEKLSLITRNSAQNGEPNPTYTPQELAARNLNRSAPELRTFIVQDWANQFGSFNPQTNSHSGIKLLQESINFLIRYRDLDNPAVVNPPLQLIGEDGNLGPETLKILRKLGENNLREIACRMEQVDAVKQLQEFMRENTPFGQSQNLDVDGIYGKNTTQSVQQFQMALVLNMVKERIEDDTVLPEPEKMELLQFFESQFGALRDNPQQFRQIMNRVTGKMNELIAANPPKLSPSTLARLQADRDPLRKLANGIFDNQTAQTLVQSWFNVMDTGNNDMTEQLVTHELGHIWEKQLDRDGRLQVYENWTRVFDSPQASVSFGTTAMTTHDYHERLHNDTTSATDYGSSNAREDFAEASRVFTYDPQRLMRRSLMKFLVMNSLHGSPFSQQDILRVARESGYTDQQILDTVKTLRGFGNIQFTTEMATKLAQDYQGLHAALDSSAPAPPPPPAPSPRVVGPASLPQSLPPLPPVDFSTIQSSPDQSGYMLEYMTAQLKSIYAAIENAADPNDRYAMEMLLEQFQRDFLAQGFEALGNEDIPVIAHQNMYVPIHSALGTGEGVAQSGRAVLLAMARMAATQSSQDFSQDPIFKDVLPAGFSSIMSQGDFAGKLADTNPHTRLSPTLLYEDAFAKLKTYQNNEATLDGNLSALKTSYEIFEDTESTLRTLRGYITSYNQVSDVDYMMPSLEQLQAFFEANKPISDLSDAEFASRMKAFLAHPSAYLADRQS